MSGIVGLFNLDGRPTTRSELDVLSAVSRHRAVHGERARLCGSFGVVHQRSWPTIDRCNDQQPWTSPSGIVVAFDGRLDDREELTRCSHPVSERRGAPSDAALTSAAYERYGDGFASHLNGDYVVAVFDPHTQQLLLARDIMAACALHYCPLPGALLFASEIKSLLADPRVTAYPDEEVVTDLVLDGWQDGHLTCFKGIYSVPPGHVLIVRGNRLELQRHWAFDPSRQVRFGTRKEYVECFRELFEQSVRRRLRSDGPVACMVSGGLDSSSIFCQAALLTHPGRLATAVEGFSWTFPAGTPADEQTFLDSLDGIGGARITRLPFVALRTFNTAEETIGHFEGPGLAWDAQHEILEQARRKGCRVILDGYFGDQMLCGRGYLLDLAWRGRWRQIRHDLSAFGSWMTDADPAFFSRDLFNGLSRAVIPRWLFQAAKKQARRSRAGRYPSFYRKDLVERLLERQLGRYEPSRGLAGYHARECYRHATGAHYLGLVQRQRALGTMHDIEVWYPFRDRDLVAFLMAIPGEIVNYDGVPKGLLRQALSGVLPDQIRNRRWKADFTTLANQAVLQDYECVERALHRNCTAARFGFVDGHELERSVAASKAQIADANDIAASSQIGRLFSLELWLQRFFSSSSGYDSRPAHQLGPVDPGSGTFSRPQSPSARFGT